MLTIMGGIADVGHAVDLAAHTGLRLGDLVRLSWSHAGEDAITGKSKHRRTAIIPLYDDLRVVLANIPKRSTTILTNVRRPSKLRSNESVKQSLGRRTTTCRITSWRVRPIQMPVRYCQGDYVRSDRSEQRHLTL
jgi:integrase